MVYTGCASHNGQWPLSPPVVGGLDSEALCVQGPRSVEQVMIGPGDVYGRLGSNLKAAGGPGVVRARDSTLSAARDTRADSDLTYF